VAGSPESEVDASHWEIVGPKGLMLLAEEGSSNGSFANNEKRGETYEWFKEQRRGRWLMRVALVKAEAADFWLNGPFDPKRTPTKGHQVLLVSFVLQKPKNDMDNYGINVVAEVSCSEDMADALLIATSIDPEKVLDPGPKTRGGGRRQP
jgi:hypothetical protein